MFARIIYRETSCLQLFHLKKILLLTKHICEKFDQNYMTNKKVPTIKNKKVSHLKS